MGASPDTGHRTRHLGLSRVAVRLPEGTEPVDLVLERAGRSLFERRMTRRFHGLRDTPVLSPGEHMEDLLVGAGREALAGLGADLVLYGHSQVVQEFASRPGFARRLCDALGVPDAEFYGVSHINCVSVLRAVEIARSYHDRPGASHADRVLVLGGDHGSFAGSARIVPGVTVAGDAAAAVVVHCADGAAAPRYRYLSGAARRDHRFHRSLRMTREELARYPQACLEHVAAVLREAADRAGLALADLDWIMPDLSSALFWRNFCRETGVERDRVRLDLLPLQGHNNAVDALSALRHADLTGLLRPGDRCALVALGHGAYFQVVVVEVMDG